MLEVKNVCKRYKYERVLSHINLTFNDTGLYGICGPSGCGKTTLLHILGGLDKDYSGSVYYNSRNIRHFFYRKKHVSFIFQFLHLIPWLNVLNNMYLSRFFRKSNALDPLDVASFQNTDASLLSLGQKQRVSYNRATSSQYDVLICDEPTGSLDEINGQKLMAQLKEISKDHLVIMASHDMKLIHDYCDAIIEMQDGQTIKQSFLMNCKPSDSNNSSYILKRTILPHLNLTYFYLCSDKKRFLRIISGLTLSLLCILITFSVSSSFKTAVNNYVDALLPANSISIKTSTPLDEATLNTISHNKIIKRQLFYDDYELLGISFTGAPYTESKTLFINDDSAPLNHLSYKAGRAPLKDNEVALSLNTAKQMCGSDALEKIIGKKIYAWYHHDKKMISIAYKVVGISENNTAMTTLYTLDNANIHLFNKKGILSQSHLAILYFDKKANLDTVIEELQHNYKNMSFKITGESTHTKVNQGMQTITYILSLFSALSVVSCLFLIGEVLYLNNIQKKHDYAVMSCFGAKTVNLILLQLLESMIYILVSAIVLLIMYVSMLAGINILLKNILYSNMLTLHFDLMLYLKTMMIGILILISCNLLPVMQLLKLNISRELK